MTRIFDTAIVGADKAPPKGSCRVCTEESSRVEPTDPKHRSYRMIGDWSDQHSAIQHARSAQETFNAAAIETQSAAHKVVVFGFGGEVLFEGVPYAPSPRAASEAAA